MPDNPVYGRDMHVVVWVDREWLTNEGEDSEEDGWRELEEQLREAITRIPIKDVHVSFEEWDGGPEVETSEYTLRLVKKR